ncbi:MAG: chemotaxis response regulator protein-glutamate methylesterase [Thermodesulfovibrionales bacterium]|nr:chemotaxis response regulator protein-glutamate methylesterase [Thermodesulfovibrionales bacterium]
MDRIRVLVVDDSAFSRQTIKKMLESEEGIEVVGIATDGIDAIAKTLKLKPDLITLDLEMPEMDGFAFLRYLMKERPTPVIVVSSYSDSKTVFRALETGAVDFIAKPTPRASQELNNIKNDLIQKVRSVRQMSLERLKRNLSLLEKTHGESASIDGYKGSERQSIEAIGIASSTGGPQALQLVLTKIPEDFQPPILISQHMPRGFTASLAERLNKLSRITVKEAEQGETVRESTAYICPGGRHMILKKRGNNIIINLEDSTREDRYIPSADRMFSSIAEHYGSHSMGVIMTGMGNDGKKGLLEIKSKGGYTIAESEETAVVFGMPQEAIKAGAVIRVLPLYEIPYEIIRLAGSKR